MHSINSTVFDTLNMNMNVERRVKQMRLNHAWIGITFFSMCQMAPSILFQWDIYNFNGPFDNLNVPKGRKWDMAFEVASTMEFYYLRTAWYMYMQSKRISEMLMWSLYDC